MASGDEQLARTRRKRYYVDKSLVPFEEDHTHEFKAHSNLTQADIPPISKVASQRSRGRISKTLNAFLNTGNGGTVYIGILDDGTVGGLNLTQFQKDHMKVALDDALMSYSPPVESHRYSLKFIPVVGTTNTPEEIDQILSFDSSKMVDQNERLRPHTLRTHLYCWCHRDSIALFNLGTASSLYVIEVNIRPWDPSDPRNRHPPGIGEMKAHPIYTDEEGEVFFRKQASVVKSYPQEVYEFSKNLVSLHYQPRIKELQRQIQEAKRKAKREEAYSSGTN